MMYSVDGFRITVHGQGAHDAYSHISLDSINIGVHIYLALVADRPGGRPQQVMCADRRQFRRRLSAQYHP